MSAEAAPGRFASDGGAGGAGAARWISTNGLPTERAWHVARLWRELEELRRPLVVLLGGGTGVGKSTVATQLAYSLGITRVSSTDFIRQVLRTVVSETIAPELSRSSFELDDPPSRDGEGPHAAFERQARQVMVGVNATIERAIAEGTSLIVEGVHLLPELVDPNAVSDAVVVYVVLSVEDGHDHWNRFSARADGSERGAARYQANIESIRELQAHVVAGARRTGIPVVANEDVDATVARLLELVSAAVERALPGGEPRAERP